MRHTVSFSGGKDSTAMLLMMLERGMQVDEIIAFDTGWEFPQMYEHWAKVEEYTGRKITVLRSKKPFLEWMFEYEFTRKKDSVIQRGYGWPSFNRRWCTREKLNCLNTGRGKKTHRMYVGIASDETGRNSGGKEYPLVEWGVTEADALQYCYDKGFDWGGLYNHFDRVSCFCCPLKRIGDLRKLRRYYPSLWSLMLEWDSAIPDNRGFRGLFRGYKTVADLDARFAKEDEQAKLEEA